jgi:hypothetical protein
VERPAAFFLNLPTFLKKLLKRVPVAFIAALVALSPPPLSCGSLGSGSAGAGGEGGTVIF